MSRAVGRVALPASGTVAATVVTSAASLASRAVFAAVRSPRAVRSAGMPTPVRALTGMTCAPSMPSRSHNPAQRLDDRAHLIGRQQVDLVEHDQGDRRVPGVRGDELGVQHLVGILLRVDDPHQSIHLAGEPFGDLAVGAVDGVEVGQIEQQERARTGIERAVEHRALPHLQPVEEVARTVRLPADGMRFAGGGATHVGFRDILTDQRVDQARLAGARGAEDADDCVFG